MIVPSEKRFLLLFSFLKKYRKKKVMVFFSSCMSVKFHHELLNYIDLPVMCIHVTQSLLASSLKLNIKYFSNKKTRLQWYKNRASKSKPNARRPSSSSPMPRAAYCCARMWRRAVSTFRWSTGSSSTIRQMIPRSTFIVWVEQHVPAPTETRCSYCDPRSSVSCATWSRPRCLSTSSSSRGPR